MTRRSGRAVACVTVLATVAVLVQAGSPAAAGPRELHVAVDGVNTAGGGTVWAPFRSLQYAFQQLRPGDTLLVHGGTYREVAGWGITPGTATAPITVRAVAGERVVVRGVLQLVGASYWTFDGINVTRDPTRPKDQFLVKLVDGRGWRYRNAEIWGTTGVSNVMIVGTKRGEPADWRLIDNCIHGVAGGPHFMNYHNVYLMPGYSSGPGVIARNLFFDVANGNHVKAAGPEGSGRGAANVLIEQNTMVGAGQGLVIAYGSHHIDVRRNLIGRRIGGAAFYPAVRGYDVDGRGNRAGDNAYFDYASAILNSPTGDFRVRDAGGNRRIQPRFASTGACDRFRPTNAAAKAYGHLSG